MNSSSCVVDDCRSVAAIAKVKDERTLGSNGNGAQIAKQILGVVVEDMATPSSD